ncbi:YkvA family protein [Ramlibacter sp.]|uniref:YkvA family protein n=1 Tax=Ramlibacter sp. TaxID=1917967 RepID=UPI003D0F2B46
MWKRLPLLWTVVRGDARRLWSALRHPGSPAWLKWGVAGIALYLVSPIDLLPDFIPFLGVVDDIVLVPLAIRWLLNRLPPEVARSAGRNDARG